jgi:hypothetical protein
MPAPSPVLDNRKLQDLRLRLRGLAGVSFAEWKPPGDLPAVGDAGVMLQLIFARFLELTLQRLNQVPEKNLLTFLDKMGVNLLAPSPAQAALTFFLKSGVSPTLVPKGSQAGTLPGGQTPAVIFETEQDLTVLPARITQAFTMDPVWDRYSDQTAVINGQSAVGFEPFVGSEKMPHVIYLGGEDLLSLSHAGSLTIDLRFRAPSMPSSAAALFENLDYGVLIQNREQSILPESFIPKEDLVQIGLTVPGSIDRELIQGVGLASGVLSRWLVVRLRTPITDWPRISSFQISNIALTVAQPTDLAPEFAFSNQVPLDTTKDFLPFGSIPVIGDAFYIGSREVLSKFDGASGQIELSVSPTAAASLVAWEYSTETEWKLLPKEFLEDGTNSFVNSGVIRVQTPGDLSVRAVNSFPALWFRARVLDSTSLTAPQVTQFRLQTRLQSAASAGATSVQTLATPFATAGDVIRIEDEYVLVTGASQTLLQITPPLLRFHAADSIVETRTVLTTVIATFNQPVLAGDSQLTVDSASNIIAGHVLLVDDGSFSEIVVVAGVAGSQVSLVNPFRFGHLGEVHDNPISLRNIISAFGGIAGSKVSAPTGQPVKFTEPFIPFGARPSTGSVFYFGMAAPGTFPQSFEIDTALNTSAVDPQVQLAWEFRGADSWVEFPDANVSDNTNNFLQPGNVILTMPDGAEPAEFELNGVSSYWIRVRIKTGNYGVPLQFIPVDPQNPARGFMPDPTTGNLNPPRISKLTIGYNATRAPIVVTQNGFVLQKFLPGKDSAAPSFNPFATIRELTPAIYSDPDPAFYVGLDNVFLEEPVKLYIAAAPRAFAGSVIKASNPSPSLEDDLPQLMWEYFNGTAWRQITVSDETNNLTDSGAVEFLTPPDMAPLAKFDLTARYWIRARSATNDPENSQRLQGVFLNTVQAIQAETVSNEVLGSSNGLANQVLQIARTPVLDGPEILVREPEAPSKIELAGFPVTLNAVRQVSNPLNNQIETWVLWLEVPNFILSGPQSRHFTLDHNSGELTFGDGTHGLIPPAGTNNIVANYRTGGGAAGNVPPGAIVQIKKAIAGVASVTNPVPADGGADLETVTMVEERGPQTLRHRGRAVSASDWEWLARQADGTRVARAKCLPNVNRDLFYQPGRVTLIIVPQGTDSRLSPGSELIAEVESYLSSLAFAGLADETPAGINVIGPGYIEILVEAKVVPREIDEADAVKARVSAALNSFFHPLSGGSNGTGWEFGRNVYVSEVCQLLQSVEGVDHLQSVLLEGNTVQRRLTFATPAGAGAVLAKGSVVKTKNGQKSAFIAEAPAIGETIDRLAVRGFKEGDRITRVLDVTVQSSSSTTPNHPTTIQIEPVLIDGPGFPPGSLVVTADGRRLGRLANGLVPDAVNNIAALQLIPQLTSTLNTGNALTIFYPFPMVITSITTDKLKLTVENAVQGTTTVALASVPDEAADLSPGLVVRTPDGTSFTTLISTDLSAEPPAIVLQDIFFVDALLPGDELIVELPSQSLTIEPYSAGDLPTTGDIVATLDNRVRFEVKSVPESPDNASEQITGLQLNDFQSGDTVVFVVDGEEQPTQLSVETVASVTDVVYLDDNFLPYSGKHLITLIEAT